MIEPHAPSSPLPQIKYTKSSMREVVIAVAHLLSHFADDKHPGLHEPQNRSRVIPETGVIVRGRLRDDENTVGFQFFATEADDNSTLAVVFNMVAYEKYGDRYLFNMLKKVAECIRKQHRPSDDRLRELATQFMLNN